MDGAVRRNGSLGWIGCLLAGLLGAAAQGVHAQGSTGPSEAFLGVITQDQTSLRSGAHDTYYPFGSLKQGATVPVVGQTNNWARVRLVGPDVQDLFGYIRYLQGATDKVRLSEDGATAVALSRIDVLAPNLTTGSDPGQSWRAIDRLEADDVVRVLEIMRRDGEIVLRVAPRPQCEGWINMAHLRPATAAEQASWERAVGELRQLTIVRRSPRQPVLARPEQTLSPAMTPLLGTETVMTGAPPSIARPQPAGTLPPAATATPGPLIVRPLVDMPDEVVVEVPGERTPEEIAAGLADEEPLARTNAQEALETLEAAFRRLSAEPIETAEVIPLRQLYLDLAAQHDTRRVRAFAEARAEQLQLWSELQERRQELLSLRQRVEMAGAEAESVRLALERGAAYAAVGRLVLSSIYDGRDLPRLLRVQDPTTGRTLAYLRHRVHDDQFNLMSLTDQLVGVVGQKQYDGGLRLNIIEPERIDLLSPQG